LEEILPPNSVMIDASMPEEWKYKAVFEHYFQKVRGSRPDVTCVSIGTPQELAQVFASGRPVFAYTMTDALAPRLVAQPFPPLLRVAPAPAAAP
jgi:hypothetical protein